MKTLTSLYIIMHDHRQSLVSRILKRSKGRDKNYLIETREPLCSASLKSRPNWNKQLAFDAH